MTDAEIDILNEHRRELGAKLLLSDQEVIKVARDKEKTKEVVDRVIVGETQFLTIPTHSFSGDEELPLIVKPKNGRSSQGRSDSGWSKIYWIERTLLLNQ